jgi:thioredoxin-like negative regulator of GroEL
MFNIFGPFKKMLGVDKKPEIVKEEPKINLANKFQQLSDFVHNKVQESVSEFGIIRQNMKHLERGNLSEAIFRFKMVKKFWPENYEAYYQLAYCLIMDEQTEKAQEVIDELLLKNPASQEKITNLLMAIEAEKKNAALENNAVTNTQIDNQ